MINQSFLEISDDKITLILTAVPPANQIDTHEFTISRNTTVASLGQRLKSKFPNCFDKDKALVCHYIFIYD